MKWFRKKTRQPEIVTSTRPKVMTESIKVSVADAKISEYVLDLKSAYGDRMGLENLQKKCHKTIENRNGKWIVYQKCCYYGGCDFDPIEFNDEYAAYKHGCIISLFDRIAHKEHDLSGATTQLADVNYECKDYCECSGMGY